VHRLTENGWLAKEGFDSPPTPLQFNAGNPSRRTAMRTNDLKKGRSVRLYNGWEARLADNTKGNTRRATVYGLHTETGSIYCHDIAEYLTDDCRWQPVEHTPAQLECKRLNAALFG